ncbi:2-hydroxyacid dehydrogenase [Mariluticola halotolerans]|uniref:2-hydroxyacid dehydrogenase n=1 Tax=Mariluticola halotolerans TaxID=2909283 RepID=UPI0026E37D87|nr:2-hydroxyacid dehydrogenase [Mariluticola halotolerans]UJQ92963.1 2-hydroxyacid dehydrogenase [Mariluticola halotolerans]
MSNEVLITNKLLQSCEDAIDAGYTAHRLYQQEDPEAFLKEVGPRIRAIAAGKVDAALIGKLPKLEMISNFGVGYDNIDTDAARARNIRVTNTPSVLNDAMAEITIGLMVGLARRLPQADRYVREGKWLKAPFPLQSELTGKTVGIVGLGRIGKEIASRCLAMKMRVVYFGRRQQPNTPYVYYDKLADMARDADWLVVITPGGAGTDGIVNRAVLEALGPKGYLVNMARGSVVDEPVMVDMLQSGGIAGAALDVFADEPNVPEALFALDNVLLSPHQGSATQQTRDAMGALVVANLDAYFAGEPLLTPVV